LKTDLRGAAYINENEVVLRHISQTSDFMDNKDQVLQILMDNKRPTVAQYKFFEQFKAVYSEALDNLSKKGILATHETKTDLILHGCQGSGRTESMVAAALYAAIARGQSVLFIVADDPCAESVCLEMVTRTKKYFINSYVQCQQLMPTLVKTWSDELDKLSPDKKEAWYPDTPEILVTTPQDLETCFFSNHSDEQKCRIMRAALLRYSAVFVDDFSDMDITLRSHLVFQIKKIRLLLASERILPQFVVAMSTLLDNDKLKQELGQRLLGLANFNSIIDLLPRESPDFWDVPVRVSDATRTDEACNALIIQCLKMGLNVLLYRKGASYTKCTELQNKIREGNHGGSFRVISHLGTKSVPVDAADKAEGLSPDAVFYFSHVSGDASLALLLNFSDDRESSQENGRVWCVRLVMEGEWDGLKEAETFPLVPDETAVSLRVAHLWSILPYMKPATPLAIKLWNQFGVAGKNYPRVTRIENALGWPHDGWHETWAENDKYTKDEIWPYLTLENKFQDYGNLDMSCLPDCQESFYEQPSSKGQASTIVLAKLSGSVVREAPRQFAACKDDPDNIQIIDLAHSNVLRFARNKDIWVAQTIESAKAGSKFVATIHCEKYAGDGNDCEIPVRDVQWRCGSVHLDNPSDKDDSIPKDLKRWKQFGNAGFCLPDCYRITASFSELGPNSGYVDDVRGIGLVRYSFDAYLSAIILGETLPKGASVTDAGEPVDAAAQAIEAFLQNRDWATNPSAGFSPVLTHAVTAVFRRKFDGWSFFAHIPVFWIKDSNAKIGQAIIWLIEPVNSGRSVYPVLSKLLGSKKKEASLTDEINKELTQIILSCNSIEKFRRESKLAFAHDTCDEKDRMRALDVIRDQRNRKRKRLDDFLTDEEKEFDAFVVKALNEFKTEIDTSEFIAKNKKWSLEEICDHFDDVLWNHPEIFWISRCSHTTSSWVDPNTGALKSVVFRNIKYYPDNSLEREKYQQDMDAMANEFREKTKDIPDEVGKVKAAHDFLIRRCEYHHAVADSGDNSPRGRSAYSALVDGLAVCEGYTMGYRYLCEYIAKIPCEEILGYVNVPKGSGYHAWNYVQLGGKWYHVDTTWDKRTDSISYEYFLLSDTAIREKDHYKWSTRGLPTAEDHSYEGKNWEEGI